MTREPAYQLAFARRVRQTFQDESGETFSAWYAQPTDVIIGKLHAWAEGRSNKHPSDIYAMLVFSFSGLGDIQLDMKAITAAALSLGPDVIELWRALVQRAQDETHTQL